MNAARRQPLLLGAIYALRQWRIALTGTARLARVLLTAEGGLWYNIGGMEYT